MKWSHNWSDAEENGKRAFVVFRPDGRGNMAFGRYDMPLEMIGERRHVALAWRTARDAVRLHVMLTTP